MNFYLWWLQIERLKNNKTKKDCSKSHRGKQAEPKGSLPTSKQKLKKKLFNNADLKIQNLVANKLDILNKSQSRKAEKKIEILMTKIDAY